MAEPLVQLNHAMYMAATLYAEGINTKSEIASRVGISTSVLNKWLDQENFKQLVEKIKNEYVGELKRQRLEKYKTIVDRGLTELQERLGNNKVGREKTKDISSLTLGIIELFRDETGDAIKGGNQPLVFNFQWGETLTKDAVEKEGLKIEFNQSGHRALKGLGGKNA